MLLLHRLVGRHFCLHLALTLILGSGTGSPRLGAAELSRRTFAVPAADAEVTLELFSDQAGAQIVYLVGDVHGVRTNPVQGRFAIGEVLDRLVAGTELKVDQDGKTGAFVVKRDRELRPAQSASIQPNPTPPALMKKSLPARLTSAFAAFAAAILSAQPASPPVPSSAAKDVVLLSPFEVQDADGSYTSSMTSSGTRIRADIRELPFSVGIVTSEFLNDFVAFNDYRDSFAYSSSVSTRGNYNQAYYVRGFQNDGQLRNGFFRAGMFDAVNVDRIEVIKGPNAAIYGRSNPGGTINVVSKRPTPFFNSYVTARVGDSDLRRYELGLSGPLGGKHVRFRIDASKHNEDTFYNFEKIDQRTVSGVLDYIFDSGARLSLEGDWLDKNLHSTNARTFFRRVGTVTTSDLAIELGAFNAAPPSAFTERELKALNLTFEHQVFSWMQFRSTAHVSQRPTTAYTTGGNAFYDVATRTVGGRRTDYQYSGDYYRSFQADLLMERDLGPTQHKLLTSFDYSHNYGPSRRWRVAANLVNNPAYNIATLSIDNPNYFMADRALLTDFYRNSKSDATLWGVFASDRVYFANKRGLLLLGARETWTDTASSDSVPNTASRDRRNAFTYQLGLNWKLAEPISAYVNYSTSYQANNGLDSKGHPFDNEKGKGAEGGFKAELLEKKFTITAALFDITRYNVVVTNPVTNDRELTGEENSKGFELDFNYQVTSSWTVFGQATDLKARIIHNVSDRTLEGFPLAFVPDRSHGVATRYDFRKGPLRGVHLTLGYKYVGQISTSTSSNAFQRNYRQPSYTQLDGSIGYNWKTGDRVGHKFNLNLKNLTNEKSFFGDRERNAGFAVVGSYTLSFK